MTARFRLDRFAGLPIRARERPGPNVGSVRRTGVPMPAAPLPRPAIAVRADPGVGGWAGILAGTVAYLHRTLASKRVTPPAAVPICADPRGDRR
jgi:hypothetical protein